MDMSKPGGAIGLSAKSQRRIEMMVEAVAQGGHQSVQSIAEALGVSEMTVRRDVAGSSGRLSVLGGQIVARHGTASRYALESESSSHVSAKLAASRHAAAMTRSWWTGYRTSLSGRWTACHLPVRNATEGGRTWPPHPC